MASYNKFEKFIGRLGKAEINLDTDVLKCYLSNTVPSASGDDIKTDLAEIASGNGYAAGGDDMQNAYSESGGTGTLTALDIVITAAGGSIGPFRYVPFYDDTHASDVLIGWWDYGSAITVLDGETFTIDFGASVFTLV